MNIETARLVVDTSFRCGANLQELMMPLKERCTPEEYKSYALAIAASMDKIATELMDKALSAHPELVEEIEQRLRENGRPGC